MPKECKYTGFICTSKPIELFMCQIELSQSQEKEALRLCKVHHISSVADLVLIYKRGELRDLFPPLGLHARVEAQLAELSVPLAKSCLLDTSTTSTIPSTVSDDEITHSCKRIHQDSSSRHNKGQRRNVDMEDLGRLVRDWFGRTSRKLRRFAEDHRCSA